MNIENHRPVTISRFGYGVSRDNDEYYLFIVTQYLYYFFVQCNINIISKNYLLKKKKLFLFCSTYFISIFLYR